MTAGELAELHAKCFVTPRPWNVAEFVSLLADNSVFLTECHGGFALGRAVAGEAELLTLAVDPTQRRQGIGIRLLAGFEAAAVALSAEQAFLEVSAENGGALALYKAAGYRASGLRSGYYAARDGQGMDAVVMVKTLPPT